MRGEGQKCTQENGKTRDADECGSQAPENRGEGQQQDCVLGLPLVLPRRDVGSLTHTLQRLLAGHMWTHPELGSLALRPSPFARMMPTVFPGSVVHALLPGLDPNSPNSGMGTGPQKSAAEILLKKARRGWKGTGHRPLEGFSFWRRDREKGQRQLESPDPQPLPWTIPAPSYLLGAGVSDNLGVPSVSLLSEEAVASESVGRAGQWGCDPKNTECCREDFPAGTCASM